MIGAEFEFSCPPSFSSKYCCLTPRLCGHVDHIDLLLWATPSVRRYGGSRVVYILQQLLLYETTRPAITGIWRGGWPSAISYCILVDHGGLEWRSKTMGQQNHLFGWYGKMANWNFSLSWDISTELADTKKITTGGIMSFPLFLEEIFKQKQGQMI